MNLYISGSNRKRNCYQILKDLISQEDKLISLDEKNIHYCIGCSTCTNYLEEYCILEDDMYEIYQEMIKAKHIIIASPIYMNFITGKLKNVIDRWNPYSSHSEILKEKKLYLILTGQMEEEENREVIESIKEYFEGLAEFMEFDFCFLKYLSSGDVETIDDVKKNYKDYKEIIQELKEQLK